MKSFSSLFCIFIMLGFCAISTANESVGLLKNRTVVTTLQFEKNSSLLTAENKLRLLKVKDILKNHCLTGNIIRIEGHASSDGNRSANYDLSLQRALAVKNFLSQHQLDAGLFLTGFGDKGSSNGKLSEQRRVEIAVYDDSDAMRLLFQNSADTERFNVQ